jgi:cell wall-associated NlpC family hydrolase
MPLLLAVLPHLEIPKQKRIHEGEGTSSFMVCPKLFPGVLIVFVALGISAPTAFAQTRQRIVQAESSEVSCSIDDPALIASTSAAESKSTWVAKPKPLIDVSSTSNSTVAGLPKFQPLLMAAIDERLGSPYHWGSTGPRAYDCSGFVWSVFQAIGIDFERSSARTLFTRLSPPAPEDQFKFGTLVFFNGLSHVGVVADEKGFYHASRHNGVVYATFEGYWGKHIDGFRRVPLPAGKITD